MGFKDHGYYGFAFLGCRPLQIVSLITIIGMTGNFIAEIAHAKQRAPSELVGTIVMVRLHHPPFRFKPNREPR